LGIHRGNFGLWGERCRGIGSGNHQPQSLVRYADFDAGTPFQSIENQLVEQIVRQLVDDAFNKAFINW
jgi:hypothetical protein